MGEPLGRQSRASGVLGSRLTARIDLGRVGPCALIPVWPLENHCELLCLWWLGEVGWEEDGGKREGKGPPELIGCGILMIPLYSFCRLELTSSDPETNRAGFKLHRPQGVVQIKGNTSQGRSVWQ